MRQIQTLILKNEHIKNKDRQDLMGVFCLSRELLANQLDGAGHLVHTIIPEEYRFTDNNKVGQYPYVSRYAVRAHSILINRNKQGT